MNKYYLYGIIFLFSLVSVIAVANNVANLDMSLSNPVATNVANIEFLDNVTSPTNSCTCPNNINTNWNIIMSDNCSVSGNCLVANITFTGSGKFNYSNGTLNYSIITFNTTNSLFGGMNTLWSKR